MLIPATVPFPGLPLAHAVEALRHWKNELANVRQSSTEESLAAYQCWAPQASEILGSMFGLVELEALISTSRHDTLLRLHVGNSHPLINGLISAEIADRSRAFEALAKSLDDLHNRCKALPKSHDPSVLVPDTNVFLHQEKRFDELDWRTIASTSDEVRLVVPMVVVRELDRHKRSASKNTVSRSSTETVRDRARASARELGTLLAYPTDVVTLRPAVLSLEMLLDPVGHARNPDPDSELIERAAALKGVTDRRVAIVTSDNGMKFAAAVAGVDVILL